MEKQKIDKRITVIKNNKNIDFGRAGNKGISISICFNILSKQKACWHPEKLEKQLNFMKDNKISKIFLSVLCKFQR